MNKIKNDLIKSPDLKGLLSSLTHYQQAQLSVVLAKDVLPIFEEKYPNDNRPRLAIEATEKWLADPSEENATKAREAKETAWTTWDAARAAGWDAWAAWAAWATAWAAAAAAKVAAGAAAWAVDYNAKSKFYKTIPDKRRFIKMLGKSK